jgi:hypothetical protein
MRTSDLFAVYCLATEQILSVNVLKSHGYRFIDEYIRYNNVRVRENYKVVELSTAINWLKTAVREAAIEEHKQTEEYRVGNLFNH